MRLSFDQSTQMMANHGNGPYTSSFQMCPSQALCRTSLSAGASAPWLLTPVRSAWPPLPASSSGAPAAVSCTWPHHAHRCQPAACRARMRTPPLQRCWAPRETSTPWPETRSRSADEAHACLSTGWVGTLWPHGGIRPRCRVASRMALERALCIPRGCMQQRTGRPTVSASTLSSNCCAVLSQQCAAGVWASGRMQWHRQHGKATFITSQGFLTFPGI